MQTFTEEEEKIATSLALKINEILGGCRMDIAAKALITLQASMLIIMEEKTDNPDVFENYLEIMRLEYNKSKKIDELLKKTATKGG